MTVAPEIIPPHKEAELAAQEARHAQEWASLQRLQGLAQTMDAQFNIPGIPFPIGLDAIIGLIPGIGDTISLGVAGYIVMNARGLGATPYQLGRMSVNIGVDWAIGLVPLIGDLIDVGWQGNLRNTEILRNHLEEKWAKERAELLGQ